MNSHILYLDDQANLHVGEENSASTIRTLKYRSRSSPHIGKMSLTTLKDNKKIKSSESLTKYSLPTLNLDHSKCKCANVLIADDDRFQHLYYQSFFSKSANFDSAKVSR